MKRSIKWWILLGMVRSVSAAMLAGWEMTGINVSAGEGLDAPGAPYSFSATTGEVDTVTAILSLGAGVNPSTSANQYGFKIAAANATTNLVDAIAKDHYLEFSLTVAEGYALNLASIEMNGGGTSTACSNVVVLCSVQGFTAGHQIAEVANANGTGGFDTDSSGFGGPIELDAAAYQNLVGTVAFRLYGWNHTSGAAMTSLRNLVGYDLMVHGNVVALASDEPPVLEVVIESSEQARVRARFAGANTTPYVLQHSLSLGGSPTWDTVSEPFTADAEWEVAATNRTGFFRFIAE